MGAGAERVKWGRDHAYTQILEVILELKLCREIRWTYGTYFITGDLRPTTQHKPLPSSSARCRLSRLISAPHCVQSKFAIK